MALKDYCSENEDEYYGQGFESPGLVSVWLGLEDDTNDSAELDVLQDLCGVGYYDLDNQESNCYEYKLTPTKELIQELSYSQSFIKDVLKKANSLGISEARWVTLQYDFSYNPENVTRKISPDPVFIGVFEYSKNGL